MLLQIVGQVNTFAYVPGNAEFIKSSTRNCAAHSLYNTKRENKYSQRWPMCQTSLTRVILNVCESSA